MSDAAPTLTLPATLRHDQVMAWLSHAALPAQGQVRVIDASALQSFDSSALACIIELRRRADVQGAHWQVQGLPERLQRLAQVYGLSDLI
ncbi:MAG: STAS domain-containing protein [Alphaproteobacteria bacterium]|nr:STAS domain-containing protein [Alphaproteobacteria bacterium]MDI9329837.1 STAS domain-containing protein [Alphaproteobacteria bacterium]